MEDFIFSKARTCFKYMTGICDLDLGYLFFVYTKVLGDKAYYTTSVT